MEAGVQIFGCASAKWTASKFNASDVKPPGIAAVRKLRLRALKPFPIPAVAPDIFRALNYGFAELWQLFFVAWCHFVDGVVFGCSGHGGLW